MHAANEMYITTNKLRVSFQILMIVHPVLVDSTAPVSMVTVLSRAFVKVTTVDCVAWKVVS
jgi:hypothetical protein